MIVTSTAAEKVECADYSSLDKCTAICCRAKGRLRPRGCRCRPCSQAHAAECAVADSPVLNGAMAYSQRTVAMPCFSVALELACLGPKTEARTCMHRDHAAVLCQQKSSSMSEYIDVEASPLCCPWKRWLIHPPADPALRSRTATVSTPLGACRPASAAQGL